VRVSSSHLRLQQAAPHAAVEAHGVVAHARRPLCEAEARAVVRHHQRARAQHLALAYANEALDDRAD
jgi:hypothetical protein